MSGRRRDLSRPHLQRIGGHLLAGIGAQQHGLHAQSALHPPASAGILDQRSGAELR